MVIFIALNEFSKYRNKLGKRITYLQCQRRRQPMTLAMRDLRKRYLW